MVTKLVSINSYQLLHYFLIFLEECFEILMLCGFIFKLEHDKDEFVLSNRIIFQSMFQRTGYALVGL